MKPMFEVSGWSLPTVIATQNNKTEKREKEKIKSTSLESDQLQSQLELLRKQVIQSPQDNATANDKGKASKKNKKRGNDNTPKSSEINQSSKPKVKHNADSILPQKKQVKDGDHIIIDKKNTAAPKKDKAKKGNAGAATRDPSQTTKTSNGSSNAAESKEKQKTNTSPQKQKRMVDNEADTKPHKKAKIQRETPLTTSHEKTENSVPVAKPIEVDSSLTPLQRKMKEKLMGAQFRTLNEQLYTTKGNEALQLFREKPHLFDKYHEGFRHQVESWPTNPVDVIIDQLRKLPKDTKVADLGCGDAAISHTLTDHAILSFDLVAKNDRVTACDIAKLPLPAMSIDVAVFSLSLMGTNYFDFLKEAYRVLKPGGELKIAEVVSRFTDLSAFIDLLEKMGFEFLDKDVNNKMFVMLYFIKGSSMGDDDDEDKEMLAGLTKKQIRALKRGAGVSVSTAKLQKKAEGLLTPCLYKKR